MPIVVEGSLWGALVAATDKDEPLPPETVSKGAVEKHVRSIMMKLRLPATGDEHRRVLAVITYLEAR
jgi:hypothetical protein